jgi:hypothetical protein
MNGRVSADGDYAMKTDITSSTATPPQPEIFTEDDWVDPLETEIRGRIQGFIEAVSEQELQRLLSRGHYARRPARAAGTGVAGHRHGLLHVSPYSQPRSVVLSGFSPVIGAMGQCPRDLGSSHRDWPR